ncbi:MAG: hypothetical protein C0403_15380 [Desulfobacterium sp.]|nr:hypothetical protein [Desulfobacterium sp.]
MDSIKANLLKLRETRKKILGCLPLYPPMEIFHAMDLIPVTLWGLRDMIRTLDESDRHIQNYSCSVARRAAEFILSESGMMLDGIFAYNACDTLRNLPEILSNGLQDAGRPLPMFQIHVPMVPSGQTDAKDYLCNEILSLIRLLEKTFHIPFSSDRFQDSVEKYNEVRNLYRRMEKQVASGKMTFQDFMIAFHSSGFLPVEDQIRFLSGELDRCCNKESKPGNHPIMISGILPPPLPVIQAIEKAGLRIVCNDIASLGRYYGYSPGLNASVEQYFVDFYENHIPCPTLLYSADNRMEYMISVLQKTSAEGVIFVGEKFCEYEYFEFPYLEKRLKDKGVPSVLIEIAVDDEDNIASLKNRIDAFAEVIGQHEGRP